AIRVVDAGRAVVDGRVDVFGAEERLVALVTAGSTTAGLRLIGQQIRSSVIRIGVADPAARGAVDRDAYEVGLGDGPLASAGGRDLRVAALVPLGRVRAEDLRHVARGIGGVDREVAAARVRLCQRSGQGDARAGRAGRADAVDRR